MSVEILLIAAALVVAISVGVFPLVAIHRRNRAALAALASDLGEEKLQSGVSYEAELDGHQYRYAYFAGSQNRPPDFKVSVDCPAKGEFKISREGRLDAFFKRLGIAAEIQTGDATFDRDFFLRTDSVAFTEAFFRSAERRQCVSRLFERNYADLMLDGKSITATMRPFRPSSDRDKLSLESVVRDLALLAESPPEDYFEPIAIGASAWRFRRFSVFALSISSAVGGIALMMWGSSAFPPLDQGAVFLASLQYSVPAFIAFVIASAFLLKGRSSSHTELLVNFAIALVGIPMFGFGATLALNGLEDRAESSVHTVEIVDKRIVTGRSTSRFVYVESWREGRDREELKVGQNSYARMHVGAILRLVTKPGRFGFEWIVDFRLVEPEP